MKTCPFCAEEIQDAAIVCKHCGRDLPANNPTSSATTSTVETEDWKKPYLKLGVLLGIPIPILGWFWAILGLRDAFKSGWPRGLYGMLLLLGSGLGIRMLIGAVLSTVAIGIGSLFSPAPQAPILTTSTPKPTATSRPTSTPLVVQGCVTSSSLQVRSGPGAEYQSIGVLYSGDCIGLDGRNLDNTWASTHTQPGGWVSLQYMQVESLNTLPILNTDFILFFQNAAEQLRKSGYVPPGREHDYDCPYGCITYVTNCDIKGIATTAGKLYFLPSHSRHAQLDVVGERGDRWFCSEATAIEQGWRRAGQ